MIRPKTPSEIKDVIKEKYRYKDLKLVLRANPSLEDYLQNIFHYEKGVWIGTAKYVDQTNKKNYVLTDLTEKGKEVILDATSKLKGNLKAVEITGGYKHGLAGFMYTLNTVNIKMGNIKTSHSLKRPYIFSYIYSGYDYAYVGDTNGFGLFILSEDFLNDYFE